MTTLFKIILNIGSWHCFVEKLNYNMQTSKHAQLLNVDITTKQVNSNKKSGE